MVFVGVVVLEHEPFWLIANDWHIRKVWSGQRNGNQCSEADDDPISIATALRTVGF